jgi:hypothetical protein
MKDNKIDLSYKHWRDIKITNKRHTWDKPTKNSGDSSTCLSCGLKRTYEYYDKHHSYKYEKDGYEYFSVPPCEIFVDKRDLQFYPTDAPTHDRLLALGFRINKNIYSRNEVSLYMGKIYCYASYKKSREYEIRYMSDLYKVYKELTGDELPGVIINTP